MDKEQTYQDLLAKWLKGELNRTQELALLKQAEEDPFLAEAMEGYVQLWKKTPHAVVPESFDVKPPKPLPRMRKITPRNAWMRAAAAIALVLGTWWMYRTATPDLQKDNTLADQRTERVTTPTAPEKTISQDVTEVNEAMDDLAATAASAPSPSRIAKTPDLAQKRVTIQPAPPGIEAIEQQGTTSPPIAMEEATAGKEVSNSDVYAPDVETTSGSAKEARSLSAKSAKPLAPNTLTTETWTLVLERYKKQISWPPAVRQANVNGKVVLSFQVNDQGRPYAIQVLESPGYGCDSTAIQWLLQGPAWPLSQDKQRVELMVE